MDGVAAEAIRDAESSLARQQSVIAQVDLQVVTAVLNAHRDHALGTGQLEQLQQDVETAVVTRPDLDTPAGARSFQRYLIGKLRDIRAAVDTADLDATSKAALAAALSSLYASATAPAESAEAPAESAEPSVAADGPAPAAAPAQPPPAPQMPAVPAWGATTPSSGGMGSIPSLPDLPSNDVAPAGEHVRHHYRSDQPEDRVPADGSTDVVLPSGATISAPSPELGNVISAAVAGTPIPEAFAGQGIAIPAVGSPVSAPVDAAQLIPGDIAIFTDRYALALGNGQALLDNRIQPISAVAGPDFIGWQHPPSPANDRSLQ